MSEILVDPQQINYCLTGSSFMHRRRRDKIIEAFNSIDAIKNVDGNYILETEKLVATSPYEECDVGVFKQLMSRPELLLHYLIIKKGRMFNFEVLGHTKVICKYSIEYMAQIENVSKDSIMRYNSALENMKLIYIARHKFDGEKRETNIYSLYDDKDLVDKYIGGFLNKDNERANSDRSLSMRYSKCIKNPDNYSEEYKAHLRKEIYEYNARMDDIGKQQPDFLLRKKDISLIV